MSDKMRSSAGTGRKTSSFHGFPSSFSIILLALLALTGCERVRALDNGLSRTPIMGYNSYNDVNCAPNETQIYSAIGGLLKSGLDKSGYKYFQIDCGWQGTERDANGSITWDATRFPNGIKPISDYVQSKGLKFGIYSDAGYKSCDLCNGCENRIGSLGYEVQDATVFHSWNAELLKYDNCQASKNTFVEYHPNTSVIPRFTAMRDALKQVGATKTAYALCEWGVQDPSTWAEAVSNSYRMSNDVYKAWVDILRIVNEFVPVAPRVEPGAFADMDLLEVGNNPNGGGGGGGPGGLTLAEQRTQFTLWAINKSPLMVSTNMTALTRDSIDILTNPAVLAANQDPLGLASRHLRRYTDDKDVWGGKLSGANFVLAAFNFRNESRKAFTIDFRDANISRADAKDMWSGQTASGVSNFTAAVDAHGILALHLSNIEYAPPSRPAVWYEAESGSLDGGARVVDCSTCSGGRKVGYVGSGQNSTTNGTLTLTGVRSGPGSTMDVAFDYINADVSFQTSTGINSRDAFVSVNGGDAQKVNFPLSGQSWSNVTHNYKASLSGFEPSSKNNTLVIYNGMGAWAPDFDRLGVYA